MGELCFLSPIYRPYSFFLSGLTIPVVVITWVGLQNIIEKPFTTDRLYNHTRKQQRCRFLVNQSVHRFLLGSHSCTCKFSHRYCIVHRKWNWVVAGLFLVLSCQTSHLENSRAALLTDPCPDESVLWYSHSLHALSAFENGVEFTLCEFCKHSWVF